MWKSWRPETPHQRALHGTPPTPGAGVGATATHPCSLHECHEPVRCSRVLKSQVKAKGLEKPACPVGLYMHWGRATIL